MNIPNFNRLAEIVPDRRVAGSIWERGGPDGDDKDVVAFFKGTVIGPHPGDPLVARVRLDAVKANTCADDWRTDRAGIERLLGCWVPGVTRHFCGAVYRDGVLEEYAYNLDIETGPAETAAAIPAAS